MTIIFNQCDKATRAKITLSSSYEDNFEAGELIKFLIRVHTVFNGTNNGNILFGFQVTKITEHHFQLTLIVEELLSAHPTNDFIWDNTNPCDASFDIVNETEITPSINITKKSTSTCRKFYSRDLVTVTISMSHDDDKSWFDAHEYFDSWYDTTETTNNYNEWEKPPNIYEDIGIINESTNKYIEQDFYISENQT